MAILAINIDGNSPQFTSPYTTNLALMYPYITKIWLPGDVSMASFYVILRLVRDSTTLSM